MANVYASGAIAIAAEGFANYRMQAGNCNRVPGVTIIAHIYAFIKY